MFCDYNCGKKSVFILSNKKNCCEPSYRKCEGYKEKMKTSCKKSYEDNKRLSGAEKYKIISEENKNLMNWSKGKFLKTEDEIFTKNSNVSNHLVKKALLFKSLVENKCNSCGIDTWMEKPLSLELDHIDGDNKNNSINNLQLLCPNCHSQTVNFRGRNINSGVKKVSDEELIVAINNSRNTRESLILVGLTPKGGNYSRVNKIIKSGLAAFKV